GICILFTEIRNFNHDISGLKIYSEKPLEYSDRAIIDFGAGGTVEVDEVDSGLLDMSDIKITAPLAENGIHIRLRNKNIRESSKLDVKLTNALIDIKNDSTGNAIYVNAQNNNKNIRSLNAKGVRYNSGVGRALRIDDIDWPSKKGVVNYTT